MAYTSWRRIHSFASGETQAREYATFSRTNNTLHVSNFKSQWRVTSNGYNSSISTRSYMSSGTNRKTTNFGDKSFSANQVFNGNTWSGNISVSSSATSISTRTRFADFEGAWYNSTVNFSIPALGSPSNIPTPVVVTSNTNSLAINTSSRSGATWGTNATADYLRIQWRKDGTSSWSQSGQISGNMQNTDYTINSLDPNTSYEVRVYCMNAGGKSGTGSIATMTTLSEIYDEGVVDIQAVTYSVTDALARAGRYTNNNKIQYRKKGDTTWIDSDVVTGDTFSITISGLLPSTTYERRFVNTTNAGTTENDIVEFTTLPAAKLVMPNGTVLNAIPRVVHPDGTVKMVKVKHL